MKRINQLLIIFALSVLLSGMAHAQTCEGTLSAPGNQVYVGSPFNVTFFNGDLNSTGYNATLGMDAQVSLTGSSPNPLQVVGIAPDSDYIWEVSAASVGNYTFNVTVDSINGSCVLSMADPIELINPIPDPNIVVMVSNMDTLTLGQAYAEQVTLFNMGPGDAFNISGVASTNAGQTVSPATYSADRLNASVGDNTLVLQFTITPTACGTGDSFNVQVTNHEDGEGNLMTPVSGSDSFNIVGSDNVFNTLTATSVSQGQDTTISYQVENIGGVDADSVSVDIYVDSSLVSTRSLGVITAGDLVNDNLTYGTSSLSVGDHNVSAIISASSECSSVNNQADATLTVTNATSPFCGDNVCNGGETCSSCSADCGSCGGGISGGGGGGGSGGGSSRIFYLDLTEEKPEVTLPLRNGDTVKYEWDGKSYSFVFRQIHAESVKMGVSESLSYKTYDMNSGMEYKLNLDDGTAADLGVLPVNNGIGQSDVTFSLLNIGSNDKKVIDILPPGSVDRSKKVVEVGEIEESVPVESSPVHETREELDNYAEGVLEFVESLDVRSKTPVWGGLLLALLIIGAGLGLYFLVMRDEEE